MTTRDLLQADPDAALTLGASRGRVLSALQDAEDSLAVTDVAARVRLHPNTARFHLDALVDAGLAARATEERESPGRPRTLYTATTESTRAGRRSYRLLAEILTSYVAQMPRPAEAARTAGEAWGRYLVERPAPFQHVDMATATQQLVRTLDDIGFAPEVTTVGRERQVLVRQCPFRETAADHSEVVCSVHLGLMQGVLAEIGAPFQAEWLDPFVEPSLCVAHLASRKKGPTKHRRAG